MIDCLSRVEEKDLWMKLSILIGQVEKWTGAESVDPSLIPTRPIVILLDAELTKPDELRSKIEPLGLVGPTAVNGRNGFAARQAHARHNRIANNVKATCSKKIPQLMVFLSIDLT